MVAYRRPDGRIDLRVDGERLVAHRWGAGPRSALLLHGMMSDHRELGALPARLADAGYTVHAVDFRGCGASDGARSVQTLPRMMADVRALAEATTRAPDLLLGHSLGAAMAIHAAAEDLVAPRAVVAAAPPDFAPARWTHRVAARLPALEIPLPRRYALSIRSAPARAWAEAEGFKSRRFPLATWAGLAGLEVAAAAAKVRARVLVLLAERDHIVPRAASLRVAAAFPEADIVEVAGYHSTFLCEGAARATERVLAFAEGAGMERKEG